MTLRSVDPDRYRPTFRVPGAPWAQLLGAIGCLAIIGFSGTTAQPAVVGLIALSLVWYLRPKVARERMGMTSSPSSDGG